jgi:hypothetical protein
MPHASALAELETMIEAVLERRRAELAGKLAQVFLEAIAAELPAASNGNETTANGIGPKLCRICLSRPAADQRRICRRCRRRASVERRRLRQAVAAEIDAASRGLRGPRARELALGERTAVETAYRDAVASAD